MKPISKKISEPMYCSPNRMVYILTKIIEAYPVVKVAKTLTLKVHPRMISNFEEELSVLADVVTDEGNFHRRFEHSYWIKNVAGLALKEEKIHKYQIEGALMQANHFSRQLKHLSYSATWMYGMIKDDAYFYEIKQAFLTIRKKWIEVVKSMGVEHED